ncbi:MAG: alpha/beta hydrolase [Gammaproteobacteria bacterium]|nr:alpha/beta hydrolase [Gammaproteobacteria bacterium]
MFTDHFTAIQSQTIGKIPHHHFLFDGPTGKLEALLAAPDSENTYNAIAVVCHPHPLYEGTLNNKITYMIAKTLADLGIPTLRFNFRGVEKSEGVYSDGIGEKDDLISAVEIMKKMFPDNNLWLGGFSFGSYIALKTSHELNAKRLITVAPAVRSFDFSEITIPDCPWVLLQGLADEVVNAQDVLDWCDSLSSPPHIKTFEGVGHYFHRRLPDIKQAILEHINNYPAQLGATRK